MASLEAKTAIVTGASSGIGAAIARSLAQAGARVAVGARRTDRLESLGEGFLALPLDVTDPASCERFVEQAWSELGRLDILVNAAGLAIGRELFDLSSEQDEETVLETNVHGLIRMTRLCLPYLEGGHVVNLGSVAGRQAYPSGSLYITSKFAVRGFTYALREDLLGRPIRITLVDPGLVAGTEFSLIRFRGDEQKADAVYEGVEAMTPEDIAECVLFAVTRPPNVNVDELVVKALAQSSGARILRAPED